MAEKRARDLERGDKFREVGDLDDRFYTIVHIDMRGDDVLIAVDDPETFGVRDWPVLDGDEVVEVER